MVLMHINDLF